VKATVQHLDDEMHEWLLDRKPSVIGFGSGFGYTSHCDWCAHDWHSAKCTTCRCDTARQRLDDTWRPAVNCRQADQVRLVCRDTGCDGWTAQFAVGTTRPGIPDPVRMKKLLYGQGPQ
jgi:hypothetical protein